jgi:hypothetical protein
MILADQFLLPWDWFTDPRWMVIGNAAFWPTYLLYVVVMDRIDTWRKHRRWVKSRA